jgi:hypothetical protein
VQYTQSFQRRFQPPYYSAYIQTASRYVCACLTQPVGQAAFGLLYGRFAALPSAVLFAAAAASIFINLAASHIFKKAASFSKS